MQALTMSVLEPLTITGRICWKSPPNTTVRPPFTNISQYTINGLLCMSMLHWNLIIDENLCCLEQSSLQRVFLDIAHRSFIQYNRNPELHMRCSTSHK